MTTPRRPLAGALPWMLAVVLGAGLTAGWWATLAALAGCVLAGRDARAMLTASLVGFAALPVVWFLGSWLPLEQATGRVEANIVAQVVAAAAVWFLAVGVVWSVIAKRGSSNAD